MKVVFQGLIVAYLMGFSINLYAQYDGFLDQDEVLFPLGFYEHPKEINELKRMAEHGVNLVHCHSREDLDRAAEAGLYGVMPLLLQNGLTDALKEKVMEVKDHPALAVWEGPDEIIWNITAFSGLYRNGVHKEPGEWWLQTENAVNYSKDLAESVIPKMKEVVEWVRSVDELDHPFWMNEALRSDLIYTRQYLEFMDITGCDIYPVKKDDQRIYRMGPATDRWLDVSRGMPIWMVLQAFAWSEIDDRYRGEEPTYPSFAQSRFMAYDVIAHGASGIQYWGSAYTKSDEFRQSLYALTSELAALQPFLTGAEYEEVYAMAIENPDSEKPTRGIVQLMRQYEDDWLLVLVNEDDQWQMGVEVIGMDELEGKTMHLLYEDEDYTVRNREMMTRIPPYGVQVFCTSRKYETSKREGRDF